MNSFPDNTWVYYLTLKNISQSSLFSVYQWVFAMERTYAALWMFSSSTFPLGHISLVWANVLVFSSELSHFYIISLSLSQSEAACKECLSWFWPIRAFSVFIINLIMKRYPLPWPSAILRVFLESQFSGSIFSGKIMEGL